MATENTNRRKGHRAEQFYARTFRDLGFSKCTTSRFGSRLHDSAKIDLVGIPFNIQIKCGRQKNLSPAKELFLMKCYIQQLFRDDAPEHKKPCLLIHRKDSIKGQKRSDDLDLVYMTLNQFYKIKDEFPDLRYLGCRKSRLKSEDEFSSICWITFNEFKSIVVSSRIGE